jgi:hypothetical protein
MRGFLLYLRRRVARFFGAALRRVVLRFAAFFAGFRFATLRFGAAFLFEVALRRVVRRVAFFFGAALRFVVFLRVVFRAGFRFATLRFGAAFLFVATFRRVVFFFAGMFFN